MHTSRQQASWAVFFLVLTFLFSLLASQIERDFGRIDVSTVSFMTEEMQPMVAKLYRPRSATPNTPKPGLLALHGYQSDKEATSTFGALELAKRGFVVLAIDHFGHGYSTKLPAANRNMSGANNGYQYLKQLPFVDKEKLGILGHSTGGLNAISVAQLNPDHRAVNGLSSKAGEMSLNNYLLTQGLYEEIGGYREKTYPVKDLVTHPARLEAFGLSSTDTLEWNRTYGQFDEGSARRAALVSGTHLGVMVAAKSNVEAIFWFNQALQGGVKDADWLDPENQSYWYKEFAGLLALFSALLSGLLLVSILLNQPCFSLARQKVSEKVALTPKQWWRFAAINIVLTMLLYPFFTQWGGANEPIAARLSFMPLEMGNGIVLWMLVSTLVSAGLFWLWQRYARVSLSEFGVTSASPILSTRSIVLRTLGLSAIALAYWYLVVVVVYQLFGVELRFLWPLLKPLTAERMALFFVYWLPILVFFFVFSGLVLSVQMKQPLHQSFTATLIKWTARSTVFAVGGLVILWLFHFVPNYLQIGPGFDVIGLPQFGGRWMMMLAVIVPQFLVFTLINHWCYLKTGYVYLGVFLTSFLMTWILVGGQVIGRFLA